MNFRTLSVALACAALFTPGYALAATQSFSYSTATINLGDAPYDTLGYSTTFNLSGFDTSLGTLTGVQFVVSNTTQATVYVGNFGAASQTYVNATTSVDVTGAGGVTTTATYTSPSYSGNIASGDVLEFDVPVSTVVQTTDVASSHWADYTHGPVTFTATLGPAVFGGTGSTPDVAFSGNALTKGKFDIVYTYTAVPEASTWAMMGLGFAGLGFAGFRSTRKTARVAI